VISALRRHLEEMRREADCLRRGCYLSFVAAQSPDRLPGRRRVTLAGIMARKVGRRVLPKSVY
jgi:hypothetical protein